MACCRPRISAQYWNQTCNIKFRISMLYCIDFNLVKILFMSSDEMFLNCLFLQTDLKLENIVLSGIDPKIADFDACVLDDDRWLFTGTHLLQLVEGTNRLLGTMDYMAPEAHDSTGLDAKAGDMWSSGVIAFNLVFFRAPYSSEKLFWFSFYFLSSVFFFFFFKVI